VGDKILVVDDEKPIADILKYNLEREGYEVVTAFDGEEALRKATSEAPALVVLDIMLPKKDGLTVCRELRSKSQVPIIMLTAKDEEVDKVIGLELGADDYVTKPFSPRELLARVKAILRRMQKAADAQKDPEDQLQFGDLILDLAAYEVRRDDQAVELTHREFELLKFLAQNPGQVFSREALLENVWGYEYYGDIRTVDVTVRRLREKIEPEPSSPQYLMTRRGVGYLFRGGADS